MEVTNGSAVTHSPSALVMASLNDKIGFCAFQAKTSRLVGYIGFLASLFFECHRDFQDVHERQSRIRETR